MAEKTLKQIADELGIDKQKAYRFIVKYNIKEAYRSGQVKWYDEAVQSLMKAEFLEKETTSKSGSEPLQNHFNDAVVDALLKQLEIKDKQIEEKDKQIERIQTLLDQEQKLHLATKQELGQLKEKNEPVLEVVEAPKGSSVFDELSEDDKREAEAEARAFFKPIRDILEKFRREQKCD